MKPEHLLAHLGQHAMGRRDMLRLGGTAALAGGLAHIGLSAGPRADATAAPARAATPEEFDDEMFDVEAVLAGAWDDTAFYERGDQRGTFREVTPEKTNRALRVLIRGLPVMTYNLGELMFNGFPAIATSPPRLYNQRLTVLGYEPPPDFEGVLQSPEPLGPNAISLHEERFKTTETSAPYTATYQIATQLDNLNHIGVGPVFYGGHRGPDIAETWGTSALGGENMGPIVTRGVLLDVLGLKLDQGEFDVIEYARNGRPHLASTYRITLEDLEAAMRRGRIRRLEAGDVVLIRTGWNQLVNPKDPMGHDPDDPTHPGHPDHVKYLATEPGIYLRETRWLASHRPAIVGSDAWGLEVVGNPVSEDNLFPCHQELLTHFGIRIGEAMLTDQLAEDGVFEFVYLITPQFAQGATAGNTPPAALGQPPRHR
ncbi:MAG: cyclase family protein [Acidimicrobiales bacterium]